MDEEHLYNLTEVLKRLRDAGLKLNFKKCLFFQDEIKYLGYIIDKHGLRRDSQKVAAIREAKSPSNVTELQSFIGMVNFYQKFVPSLATKLAPLYKLLESKKFLWTKKEEENFKIIKEQIYAESNLVHFNPKLPIKLKCDASNVVIGSVLLHVLPDGTEKPICFASRVLRGSEKNYAVIHKEALAIYWSIQKFYQYLIGNHFILCTDHKPLLALFGEKKGIPQMAAGRLQRWALFISGLNYEIQFIKGTSNETADTLSRLPKAVTSAKDESEDYFHFIVENYLPINGAQILKELRKDKILSKVYLYKIWLAKRNFSRNSRGTKGFFNQIQ